MDFSEMDLGHLIILWLASGGNIALKVQLETELQRRIAANTNFSREYIFGVSRIQNHAVGIEFIPTSVAYQRYGSNIVIEMTLTNEEFTEMLANRAADPPINTQGNIRARILVNGNLTPEQIEAAATVGFHTRDIFETSHV